MQGGNTGESFLIIKLNIEIKKPECLLPIHAAGKYSLLLGVRSIHAVLLPLIDLIWDRVATPIRSLIFQANWGITYVSR